MAFVRMSFKEDSSINDPRKCIDRLVHEFVSGNPLDEKVAQDYQKARAGMNALAQQELDLIYHQIKEAYLMREKFQNGQVHPRAYAAATAPLLEYEARTDKKAA